jgi:hypothetical protein
VKWELSAVEKTVEDRFKDREVAEALVKPTIETEKGFSIADGLRPIFKLRWLLTTGFWKSVGGGIPANKGHID